MLKAFNQDAALKYASGLAAGAETLLTYADLQQYEYSYVRTQTSPLFGLRTSQVSGVRCSDCESSR